MASPDAVDNPVVDLAEHVEDGVGIEEAQIGSLVRSIDAGADEVSARAALITAMLDGAAMQVHTAACDDTTCKDLITRSTALVESIATG